MTQREKIEEIAKQLFFGNMYEAEGIDQIETLITEARIDELQHITGYSEARGICTNASFPLEMNTEPIGERLKTLQASLKGNKE